MDAFFTQKAGNASEEYEDAFWPLKSIDRQLPLFRAAIADGATETCFAGPWARLLVRAYCRGMFSLPLRYKNLLTLQHRWREQVSTKSLPWYAEAKLTEGAYSSLVGITLKGEGERGGGSWKSVAIGDSCMFQLRGNSLVSAFPFERSEQFNNRPVLLGSTPIRNDAEIVWMQTESVRWEAGDSFYLMTDALAAWFLRRVESDESPWEIIRDLSTDSADFVNWTARLRQTGDLRNDDVTLVRVETAY